MLRPLLGNVTVRLGRLAAALPPQAYFVFRLNRKVWAAHQASVDTAWDNVSGANVDLAAATAVWQFDSDRLNGLVAKGTAVLAADAILVTGIATQAQSTGPANWLCMVAMAYLCSALLCGFWVHLPRERRVVTSADVVQGPAVAARKMLAANISNVRNGIAMQNLVYVGFRDTVVAAVLLLGALMVTLAN